MKKILIILLLAAGSAGAQPITDWGAGYDINTHKVTGTVLLGYEAHNLVVSGQITPSLTRAAAANNYFGLSAGYDIAGLVVPSIGYYYNLKSTDDKSLNYAAVGYGIKVIVPLTDNNSGIFISGLKVKNNYQLSAGIHAVIY